MVDSQKWEYSSVEFIEGIMAYRDGVERMNRFGEAGWELVAVDNGRLFYKRPKMD